MVFGSVFQYDVSSVERSIDREERMEDFDDIFHLEVPLIVGPGEDTEMGDINKSVGDGLDALELSLNVFGIEAMPLSNEVDLVSEAMSLSLLGESDLSHHVDPISTECLRVVPGENSMVKGNAIDIRSLCDNDPRPTVIGDTEDVSISSGEGLTLPDRAETEDAKPSDTGTKTPLPKMMELADFILHMEGIKDIYTASTMTEEIMEEIVDNAVRETAGKLSPSTGETVHCPDTPCGKDTNYSQKNSSIKNVVSKAKDASPKSTFLPPCRVCGDNASGFHYGANTCEACKGFFRRSIVKVQQNKESYKCVGKGEGCILGPGKRNPCAACRYARCLDVGMSIGAIKTGRYTYEKRTKDTVEVRTMQAAERPTQQETYISDMEVDQIIQSLKEVLLRNCPEAYTIFDRETNLHRQWQIYNDYKAKVEIFGTMSVIPKEIWDEFYKETGIDLDNRQDLMKEMACRMEHGLTVMVDFVRAIPGFSDLSVSDQTELIKASHFEFFFLMMHKNFNSDLRVVSGAIGLHENEINKLAEKEAVDQLFNFSTSLKNLNLALDEIILVRGISVTFTDRCQLEDPKAVEQIQWKLINALRVLAKRKNYKPEQRLWHILDRLTALRTMTEISKELDKQKCSWPVMKEHPLVLDILQS